MTTKQNQKELPSLVHINRFDAQFDNRVKNVGAVDWAILVEFFLAQPVLTTDKQSVSLFNVAQYKHVDAIGDPELVVSTSDGHPVPRRKQVNVMCIDSLVLDFDGGLSIQDAKERFKEYAYVAYTSHSHMREGGIEKFRLIIQLTSPIQTHMTVSENGAVQRLGDWFFVQSSLTDFAKAADPKSFESNTMYFLPSCHPDRQDDYQSWSNAGAPFDWTQLSRSNPDVSSISLAGAASPAAQRNADLYLSPDDVLSTRHGPIRVGDINRNIDGVVCPFHDDTSGGEFVARSPAGRIFLHCKHCKTIYMRLPDQQASDSNDLEKEFRLPPEYQLRAKKKVVRVKDVKVEVTGVSCPFHSSSKAHGSVRRLADDSVRLECEICGPIYMDQEFDPARDPDKPYVSKSGKQIVYPPQQPNFDDLLGFDTKYYDASDRSLVESQLDEICTSILNDKTAPNASGISYPRHRSHILFMPEGSGKSLLAREMARLGKKIIFACKSWNQAFDKYDEFKAYGDEHGFSVDLFLSKDAKARRRFGVGVARRATNDPYRIGKIDKEKSLSKFKDANPNLSDELIRISWNFFTQDELHTRDYVSEGDQPELSNANPLFDRLTSTHFGKNADILVTTHAQLRTISQREQYIPRDRIIWFDDPDIWDVIDIERYDPKRWPNMNDDDVERRTITINNRRYFRRDAGQSLGISQEQNTCVYTTTESVTKLAIEKMLAKRKERYVVHDKMNHLFGGRISILGTSKVRRDLDGIIPVISRLLEKQGYNNVLIANGLATPLNHSNNKGNNKLKDNIILVELSIPHPHEILTCYDALGISPGSDGNEMGRAITLDRMHQAIGRNSGYRWAGCECVILADSKYHSYLIENVRYKIDRKNSVLIDHTRKMSRSERRTTDSVSDFVAATETLVTGINQLVTDTRRIRPAIKYVFQQISDADKAILYAARLLRSFASHADKDFWLESEPDEATTHLEQCYKGLGDWMLQACISQEQRECALNEYQPQEERDFLPSY